MRLARPRLVSIDLDGTLADTVADLGAALNQSLTAQGRHAVDLSSVRDWIGNGVERLLHRALTGSRWQDAPMAELTPALDHFREAYRQCSGDTARLYPGVRTTLETLRDADMALACVTNKGREFTPALLERLGIASFFDVVLCGDSLDEKKPHPMPLLHAATQAGVEVEHCLHVGDSTADIRAAQLAGFTSVWVSYGYHQGSPVHRLDERDAPHATIDRFDELVSLWQA